MTIKEYLADAALTGETTITQIIAGDLPVVRTDHTWFHPQGGGQKSDRGSIGGIEIYNVRHATDGEIDHYVASTTGLAEGDSYPFFIDADWRKLNSNYHTAGHLVAGVVERLFPLIHAVSGHQWPGEARVEFRGPGIEALGCRLGDIQAALDRTVDEGLPIHILGDPFRDRSVQIGTLTPIPCGGTHASVTTEIGSIVLRSTKTRGDTLRLGYEVGP